MNRRWRRLLWFLLLAAAWLLLQQSVALPQLIVAALVGWGVPTLVGGFARHDGAGGPVPDASPASPTRAGRRAVVALRLSAVVLWDIVLSNLIVARIVLSPRARPQPAWVPMPLTLRDPTAISLLATIITTTPGTVSCVIDDERWEILVHALDCEDPAAMAEQMRARYEAPLKEIFE